MSSRGGAQLSTGTTLPLPLILLPSLLNIHVIPDTVTRQQKWQMAAQDAVNCLLVGAPPRQTT